MPKRKIEITDTDTNNTENKQKISGHWSLSLLKTMKDPKYIIKADDLTTVIRDMYPKAEFHYLVLPKANVSTLKALSGDHLNLLKHMEKIAKDVVNDAEHNHKTFKLGYHAEASMSHLHLHVISDDMNSPCLKNKKHWNSFNTNFFLKSEDVLKNLEENGKVILPTREICKKYMELPLKCHKCEYMPKNFPDLKKHILTHLK